MNIRLLVLRTGDITRLADFYSLLGLTFHYHQHGQSPFHYTATIGETVLEIYPLAKGQTEADKNLRIGFSIDHFETIVEKLQLQNIPFLQQPTQTEFGLVAIITDTDGRKVELYNK